MRPKLLYTIPEHQNPAGVSLSLERRKLLVELARRYGFVIVEDVAYRELGFEDESLPSLWTLGPDIVVQVGTTSKTLFPGVRLGWAAGPAEVVDRLVAAKQVTDQCAGALGQRLQRLVPDLRHHDVFVCGPEAMMSATKDALRQSGVPRRHIHDESFTF